MKRSFLLPLTITFLIGCQPAGSSKLPEKQVLREFLAGDAVAIYPWIDEREKERYNLTQARFQEFCDLFVYPATRAWTPDGEIVLEVNAETQARTLTQLQRQADGRPGVFGITFQRKADSYVTGIAYLLVQAWDHRSPTNLATTADRRHARIQGAKTDQGKLEAFGIREFPSGGPDSPAVSFAEYISRQEEQIKFAQKPKSK